MKNKLIYVFATSLFLIFIAISFLVSFKPGKIIASNLIDYSFEILQFFPFAFILIGLFQVWMKRETVEKHLGKNSGWQGYFWAIILGGCTFGPLIVALPIAHSLYKKGAGIKIILTYIGASAICRIPMTIFEASYLGVPFTIVRYSVSLPLVVISSIIFGSYLEKANYKIKIKE